MTVVAVASSTQILGVSDMAHIAIGDTLSIKGNIDSGTGVVTAQVILDESQKLQSIAAIQQQIQALLVQLKALQAQAGIRAGN